MHIEIRITEQDVKSLILAELARRLGEIPLDPAGVKIEVKSKQNYKSEWEVADFRATYLSVK